jgi:hypothetical protein
MRAEGETEITRMGISQRIEIEYRRLRNFIAHQALENPLNIQPQNKWNWARVCRRSQQRYGHLKPGNEIALPWLKDRLRM